MRDVVTVDVRLGPVTGRERVPDGLRVRLGLTVPEVERVRDTEAEPVQVARAVITVRDPEGERVCVTEVVLDTVPEGERV